MEFFLKFSFVFLSNPLNALGVAFLLLYFNQRNFLHRKLLYQLLLLMFIIFYITLWISAIFHEQLFDLLRGMNNPLVPSIILLVYPALSIRKTKFYKFFLCLPFLVLVFAIYSVVKKYLLIPSEDRFFAWILIDPELLFASVISLFLLLEPFLTLNQLRWFTRILAFVILIFGGFMFRKDFNDYKDMLSRRKNANKDFMLLTETIPVLSAKGDGNYSYLPSAPCRFAPDGGYVQGCNMEMFQRIMQINERKIINADPVELKYASKLFGALVFFLSISLICARWFCGWICPLSTAGDMLDLIRRLINLPHLKVSQPIKISYFLSGISFASFGLLLAKLYPHVDENGKFMGCKIPIFPFCKLCPAQQICPTYVGGLSNYPPIPGWEWVFGFYRIITIPILLFFLISFAVGRRLWCYFCPMGMISGIFNRGGLLTLRKNPLKCNSCGVCYEVCPMQIDNVRAEMKETNVSSFDCVLCLKCIEKCPQDNCLSFEFAGRKICSSKFTYKD